MNLKALVASLSDEEKRELLEIMSATNDDVIVRDESRAKSFHRRF